MRFGPSHAGVVAFQQSAQPAARAYRVCNGRPPAFSPDHAALSSSGALGSRGRTSCFGVDALGSESETVLAPSVATGLPSNPEPVETYFRAVAAC